MIFTLRLLAVVALAVGQAKTAHTLPAGATEINSVAGNVPDFMVTIEEGGRVPSEAKTTCNNRPDGSSSGSAGIHLEHYYPAAKMVFDQKVSLLKQSMGLKQAVETEAASNAMGTEGAAPGTVVMETLDGMEAAYFVRTTPCVEDTNPKATTVHYRVRIIRDTTYADITVQLFASGPDPARKLAREMMQKVAALNYATIK